MRKQLIVVISLIFCTLSVYADDSIKVSAAELQQLIQRIERLEQKTDHPNKLGVDAVSGATRQVPKDTTATDTAHKVESQNRSGSGAEKASNDRKGRFTIGGYGEVTAKHCFYSNNYLRYGKNPEKYANDHYGEFDLPHVVVYMGYDFGKGWSVGTEIEFEHGGTESAIEIEEEEGGEYEGEIERGGEVALEQFWLQKEFNRYAILRAGMQVIPVGGLNAHHEPTEYFSVYRNEGEFTIIPSTWHEVALTFMGSTPNGWHYQAMFLPGLDSDRFNRKNWIKPGAGSPYEFKLANVFAGAARVDYTGVKGLRLSLSGYCGNSFRNTLSKSNSELDASAYKDVKGTVSIGSFDFAYKDYGLVLRGGITYGHLSDAAAITQYNIAMRKGSVSSKQWVASDALAAGIEAGYDFFSLSRKSKVQSQKLYLFGRYDYYDSMFRYDNKPTDMYAWCGRHRAAVGINYFPIPQIGVKAEFSYGILKPGTLADGTKGKLYNDEPQIAVGIVYAGFYDF
ncbi:MAG: hypothetical protein IKG86_03400 [Paludibacteraceae bacterium]|nr:hypothetical protein [Paludibacteraceae bacterium]